jgi:hypothetical protein
MALITAMDIASFRNAERVVLTEEAGVQKVACHMRSGRGKALRTTTDEITIHRFAGPSSPQASSRPGRSVTLSRSQMSAWRRLCGRLHQGDHLTLGWEDSGWPRRRTTVTVLVTRGAHLHRYSLGDAGRRHAVRPPGIRPGRIVLVAVAALGLWWLARHFPTAAAVVAALVLFGIVVHRRRARDGWPLGTVRWLRLLAFLAITAMPVVLTLVLVAGVIYAAARTTGWVRQRRAWWDASGGWGGARPARSWHVDRRGGVLDMGPDTDGVHRWRASANGSADGDGGGVGDVIPIAAANGAEPYRRHVEKGAELLDGLARGWEQRLDGEDLADAADPGEVILLAVFGGWDAGLDAVVDHLNSRRSLGESPEEERRAGALEDCIRASFGDACTHIGHGSRTAHQRALRAAWCDELARRARDHAPAS